MILSYSGLNSGGLWAGNDGDIVIRGVNEDIRIRFTVSDQTGVRATFTERYTSVSGTVRVQRLGDVAKKYFEPVTVTADTSSISWGNRVLIQAEIFDLQGSALGDFGQSYYYSSFPMDRIAPPADYKNFLSRFNRRSVLPDQMEFVSYIDHGQRLVVGIAYADQIPEYGVTATQPHYKEITLSASASGQILIQSVSLSRLCDLLAASGISVTTDQILLFDLYLFDGDTQIDLIRYTIDRRSKIQRTDLVYYNPFLCPEVLCMTGSENRTADLEATYLSVGTGYQKVHTDLIVKHESYTGYIQAESHDAVYDLIVSEPVYQVVDGRLERITLLEADVSETLPHTEPVCLKLTYRVSDTLRQLGFWRGNYTPSRIFDKTFDKTFD